MYPEIPTPPANSATPSKWKRILAYLKREKFLVIAIVTAIVVAASLIGILLSHKEPEIPKQTVVPKPKKVEPKFYSPLTGVQVADEATTKRHVTAIMIENSPDARPQSGLKDAGIVFEAIAEGGITRFIALYQEARPGLIGPVRSVRPYYVEWAGGYDAAVAHIGGSANALAMIRSGNYGVDLDQFFNAGAYWRATDRYAPHNVYTSFDRLDALSTAKGKTTSSFAGFARKEDTKATPNAGTVNIAVSSGTYNVGYTYDATSNSYVRILGGVGHTDREGGQIQPKVAIALRVENTTVFEDGTRQSYKVVGNGQAYVFQDGTVQEVTWSKADARSPLVLHDAAGKDVALNRGQTWITAVAPGKTVTWQ
jgi:hypothetical protein